MKKSVFAKISTIVFNRPTQFISYLRQTYLFFQTYFLRKLFIDGKPQYRIGNNVRLQALKSLFADTKATITIFEHTIIYENAKIEAFDEGIISIGKNSIIGDARICSRNSITIGMNFLTSWNVFIQDFDSHPVMPIDRAAQVDSMTVNFYPSFGNRPYLDYFQYHFPSEPIVIGDNVWVGANVTILKGARIGHNSILATGAVVLKGEYPNNAILAGNPAKVVKIIN